MIDIKKRIDDFEAYLSNQTKSSINTVKKYKLIVRMLLYDNLAYIEQPNGTMSVTIDLINSWLSKKNETKNTTNYKFALRMYLISLGYNKMAENLMPAKTHQRKKVFKYIFFPFKKEKMRKSDLKATTSLWPLAPIVLAKLSLPSKLRKSDF